MSEAPKSPPEMPEKLDLRSKPGTTLRNTGTGAVIYTPPVGKDVIRETAEVVAGQLGALEAGSRLLIGFDMPVVTTSSLPIREAESDRDRESEADVFVVTQCHSRQRRLACPHYVPARSHQVHGFAK